MKVAIGYHWQRLIDELVSSGRYGSASEVVHEGLRLVEEREAKLKSLRDTLNASIAEGGSFTDEEVGQAIDERLAELQAALVEGEESGPPEAFDFDRFIAAKSRRGGQE